MFIGKIITWLFWQAASHPDVQRKVGRTVAKGVGKAYEKAKPAAKRAGAMAGEKLRGVRQARRKARTDPLNSKKSNDPDAGRGGQGDDSAESRKL